MSPSCRKLSWAVLLAAAVCTLPHPATAVPPREPDYRGQVCRYVPIPLAGKRPNFVDRIAQGPLRGFCEETAVAARLWQWTGRAEYAEEACQRLTALLDVWELQHQPGKPWKRVCFFSACPIIDAYRLLRSGRAVGRGVPAAFPRLRPRSLFRPGRRDVQPGLCPGGRAGLGRQDSAGTARGRLLAQFGRGGLEPVAAARRHGENAAAYNGIALTYLFLLADALDHNDQLQEPRLRRDVRPLPRPGQSLGGDAGIRRFRRRRVGHVPCLGHLGLCPGAGRGPLPRRRLSLGRRADVPGRLPTYPRSPRAEKVSGTFCPKGPPGATHKRFLTPFPLLRWTP